MFISFQFSWKHVDEIDSILDKVNPSERLNTQGIDWKENRGSIFLSLLRREVILPPDSLCSQCGIYCTICCTEYVHIFHCSECDKHNHRSAMPFHVREYLMIGFFHTLPAGLSVQYQLDGIKMGYVTIISVRNKTTNLLVKMVDA